MLEETNLFPAINKTPAELYTTDMFKYVQPLADTKKRWPVDIHTRVSNFLMTRACAVPRIKIGKEVPNFHPVSKTITLPAVIEFPDTSFYYCIMFHEIGHAYTNIYNLNSQFGTKEGYIVEEIAVQTAAFVLCRAMGIESPGIETYTRGYVKTYASASHNTVLALKSAMNLTLHLLKKFNIQELIDFNDIASAFGL